MIDETTWTITRPGVLALPHTKYEIRASFEPWGVSYDVWYDGMKQGIGPTPEYAMDVAARHMQGLISMGIDP